MKFKEFGWTGFLLEVPEEMRFARQGGDNKQGHFMLEAETYMIEAKWDPFEPKKAKPLSQVADAIVEHIKKQSKKQAVTILGRDEAYVSNHKALFMVARSQVEERIYIWYCDESQRLVIFRFVSGIFDEAVKKMTKRALDSLRCHSEQSDVWSLLNLRFQAPNSFLLTDTKITVGRAHFMLTNRKLSSFTEEIGRILIEYFSMANLLYEETYRDLGKWFEKNYLKNLGKRLKERKMKLKTVKSTTFRRHKIEVRQGTVKSGVSWRRTTLYSNATWYCPTTNRIYSVTVSSSIKRPSFLKREIDTESHTKMLDDLLSSFVCH